MVIKVWGLNPPGVTFLNMMQASLATCCDFATGLHDAVRIGQNVYLRALNRHFMSILSPLMVITQTLCGTLAALIGLIKTIFGSVPPIIDQL